MNLLRRLYCWFAGHDFLAPGNGLPMTEDEQEQLFRLTYLDD